MRAVWCHVEPALSLDVQTSQACSSSERVANLKSSFVGCENHLLGDGVNELLETEHVQAL